jgi:hypothetical protein
MNDIIQKFVELEREIAKERGDFALFALILRPGLSGVVSTSDDPGIIGRWDLVVSAPWVGRNQKEELEYFVRKLRMRVGETGTGFLSRIVMLTPTDQFVRTMNASFRTDDSPIEVLRSSLSGVEIERAYIIRSKASSPEVAPKPIEK